MVPTRGPDGQQTMEPTATLKVDKTTINGLRENTDSQMVNQATVTINGLQTDKAGNRTVNLTTIGIADSQVGTTQQVNNLFYVF